MAELAITASYGVEGQASLASWQVEASLSPCLPAKAFDSLNDHVVTERVWYNLSLGSNKIALRPDIIPNGKSGPAHLALTACPVTVPGCEIGPLFGPGRCPPAVPCAFLLSVVARLRRYPTSPQFRGIVGRLGELSPGWRLRVVVGAVGWGRASVRLAGPGGQCVGLDMTIPMYHIWLVVALTADGLMSALSSLRSRSR